MACAHPTLMRAEPGSAPPADAQPVTLAWPAVRSETKPWSRWWWFGNIADEQSLTAEMERCAAAGLGGLELTPVYGVRGYEDRFVPYLSPRWIQLLQHTLTEARRLGLGLDLATGTGWPFGGPWLDEQDAAHTLVHRSYQLAANARLREPIRADEPGLIRVAGPRQVRTQDLREPVTANSNLQDLALDQVRFPKPLRLVTLMAFPAASASPENAPAGTSASPASDVDGTTPMPRGPAASPVGMQESKMHPAATPLDLTALVRADGTLDWTAPADSGSWTLHALFDGPHGKMVERAAPGGEGYALDHFSSAALARYLARFDTAFAECHLLGDIRPGIRAFFNDSYEVDDADGESSWTPQFFAEFQQRRGYDLRTRLPELFATAESDASARVLSDYRETISDLLLDEFTRPWRAWANARSALIRNQAHNAPANILDLYAASDIPEQEGNGFFAMKLASSAAHVTGKPLASAETATWLNEHFLTTLAELKRNADGFLLAGINHLCYHGTASSPSDAPWPGFNFYASVELNPANPLWTNLPALNAYLTRAQSFLQSGLPDEDVLLYYNIHDRWAERGDGRLPHFGHGGRDPVGVTAGVAAAALHEAGVGFDYVSDRQLATATLGVALDGGPALTMANARYRAIVVPATTLMPMATLTRLLELAAEGATILVLDHLPRSAPGLRGLTEAPEFNRLLQQIPNRTAPSTGIAKSAVGRGQILVGGSLAALLNACPEVLQEPMRSLGLEHVRRRTASGALYFIVNRSPGIIDAWVPLAAAGTAAALYDPMTGAAGRAAIRPSRTPLASKPASEVYLQLAPGASCIVQLHATAVAGPAWYYWQRSGDSPSLAGEWSVAFIDGGPALPAAAQLRELRSWTDFAGEAGRAFSGTAVYTQRFARPPGDTPAWELDLGTVCDSAQITLNGRVLATLIQPPWRIVIPSGEWRDENTLQIAVTNLAANRIAELDRRGVPWKIFYNANFPARLRENTGPDRLFTAAHWTPRNSGLLGPVKLTPIRAMSPGS